ncbi:MULTISPECIES: curli-like amyloid fiber formation chaperone CsgH [unclassified Roseovarius]|uniref:curli-like amyloid fiber formation chaperone CsgH n=1 Tax=unclassified Roseovarius TaxID=2614913 RepID=UPI00273FBBDC|nr:curli-like amyloid fiber formation chaperone CsgH [Roseovarius sp. MMSF_3350]
MRRHFFTLPFLLAWPLLGNAEEQRQAWIELSEGEGLVQIEVFSHLEEGMSGKYTLEVVKEGPSGRSVNKQGGNIPNSDGTPIGPLSVSRVSVEPSATLQVTLSVTDASGSTYHDTKSMAGD